MLDVPADTRAALELRYDGPIPAQHLANAQTARRRKRGTLSVLESQVSQFLDAAERCQGEMEDVMADLTEPSGPPMQRQIADQKLHAGRERCEAHIRAAAEALRQAIPLRRELGLGAHPIAVLATLLTEEASSL